jgi:undecaprenol kinase/diacylglycerol kinase (ATP)
METETKKERKAWSLVRRAQSFAHAFRGLKICIATTPNLLIHFVVTVLVIAAGIYFKVSEIEWIALIFAIGFVIVTEVLNTAFEIDINLTSPEYHPFARDTKDVAAGAVLLAVLFAIIIGIIVFLPKLLVLYFSFY